ncbi:MAG: hypothetical protein H6737_15830 [Alphaproteobacteria bacterium]|nr:hypothetical protein [Alphaproteobacteria bacterium]
MDLVTLTGGCVLAVAEVAVEPTDTGWTESAHIEVLSEGSCDHVDLRLPAGVRLGRLKARTHLSDGTKRRIDEARQRRVVRDLAGDGAIRLYAPELIPGDRVDIDVIREHPPDAYTWAPAGSRYASLVTSVPYDVPEGANPDRTGIWVANAPDTLQVVLPHPVGSRGDDAVGALAPVTDAKAEVLLELLVPGEPMRTLYPGGGSSLRTAWTVSLPDGDARRGLVLPVPMAATEVAIEGTHIRRDDSVVLWAEPGEAKPHRVSWVTPDAPVYGEKLALAGAEVTQTVQIEDGRIRWQDGETWWLGAIGVRAIVPDRSLLVRALENRFRRAAIPEPAIPPALRGRATDWEMIAQLKPELARRAGVADLPLAPLFPRRLVKARKTGALTSVEAALVLWLQANQARVPAAWAVVRPASEGPGWHTSPAGYDEGLVAVNIDGTTRWIDPACRVCGAFEIRPDLEDADMLSPIGIHTPDVREGALAVTDADGTRTVEMSGPAALSLRLWLAAIPSSERATALAERFGGPGATLAASEKLAEAGSDLKVVVTLPDGAGVPDPLAPPDGDWWGWIGERRWTHPAAGDDVRRHEHQGPLCWTARTEGDVRTEILTVRERRIPVDSSGTFDQARRAPPPPPVAMPEPDVSQPGPESGEAP